MSPLLEGWIDNILQFDFTTSYIPGNENELEDALSRNGEPVIKGICSVTDPEMLQNVENQFLVNLNNCHWLRRFVHWVISVLNLWQNLYGRKDIGGLTCKMILLWRLRSVWTVKDSIQNVKDIIL